MKPAMLALVVVFCALGTVACADQEVVDACGKAAACGADQTQCITERQQSLGEIGGRCGDARDEALAVYVCQGTLACDQRDQATYETTCATALTAYHDARTAGAAAGAGGCTGAPEPVAP